MIDGLAASMGIVEDGDTATHAIAQGQYVIWKKALYTADAAITVGTTLVATGGSKNLTAVENGGLNALNASLPRLLWTNPNPDASFNSQTVLVDMSYPYYKIQCKMYHNYYSGGEGGKVVTFAKCTEDKNLGSIDWIGEQSNYVWSRTITMTESGIKFSNVGGLDSDNGRIIPVKIYGSYYP